MPSRATVRHAREGKEAPSVNIHLSGASPSKAGRTGPREFCSTDHLSTEAIAAFADGELSRHAAHRARLHIVACEECRREVNIQRSAAERLRSCGADESIRAPRTLVERLAQVAEELPGDGAPDSDGPGKVTDAFRRALKRRG